MIALVLFIVWWILALALFMIGAVKRNMYALIEGSALLIVATMFFINEMNTL